MKTIHVFAVFTGTNSYGVIGDAEPCGDTMGYAVDEDAGVIASHWSSGPSWTQHDMGITSDWKHDIYNELYPDGWEIEWHGAVKENDFYNWMKERDLVAEQE